MKLQKTIAVINEMQGYQNDPASVLFDAVAAAALQAHPYRNNTIGFESDVRSLTLEDARLFYDRHYAPGNAVLAIAGAVVSFAGLGIAFGLEMARERLAPGAASFAGNRPDVTSPRQQRE